MQQCWHMSTTSRFPIENNETINKCQLIHLEQLTAKHTVFISKWLTALHHNRRTSTPKLSSVINTIVKSIQTNTLMHNLSTSDTGENALNLPCSTFTCSSAKGSHCTYSCQWQVPVHMITTLFHWWYTGCSHMTKLWVRWIHLDLTWLTRCLVIKPSGQCSKGYFCLRTACTTTQVGVYKVPKKWY